MDWTPYASAAVAAVVAGGTCYGAVMSRLARLEVRLDGAERQQADVRQLSVQMTELAVKIDELKEDVAKHNRVIERTYQLESETRAQRDLIEEIRGELHDARAGRA